MSLPLVSVIIPTCNRSSLLRDCLESVISSSYSNLQIIVVDDNSNDDTQEIAKEYSGQILFIKNRETLRLIKTRNLGAKSATGKYFVFIDDDNIINKSMIEDLVFEMENNSNIGVCGPMMYYNKNRDLIWWSETKISLFSARTFFPYRNQQKNVIIDDRRETEGIPNLFLVRKTVFEQLNGLDEAYFNTWHESDFCERVKRIGYKVLRIRKAETYHQVDVKDWNGVLTARSIGDNPAKAYTTIRNRYKYVREYFPLYGKISFLFLFSWLLLAYYIFSAIKLRKREYVKFYLKGMFDGLKIFIFR